MPWRGLFKQILCYWAPVGIPLLWSHFCHFAHSGGVCGHCGQLMGWMGRGDQDFLPLALFPRTRLHAKKFWVGGGGLCENNDSQGPKIRILDFGLIFWNKTSDSGLQASDFGLRLVNYCWIIWWEKVGKLPVWWTQKLVNLKSHVNTLSLRPDPAVGIQNLFVKARAFQENGYWIKMDIESI